MIQAASDPKQRWLNGAEYVQSQLPAGKRTGSGSIAVETDKPTQLYIGSQLSG
jgi:hypothetical protein